MDQYTGVPQRPHQVFQVMKAARNGLRDGTMRLALTEPRPYVDSSVSSPCARNKDGAFGRTS